MINNHMRIHEVIKPLQPLKPGEQRLNGLKQQKQAATTAVKAEQNRVKKQKASAKIQQAQQTINKLNQTGIWNVVLNDMLGMRDFYSNLLGKETKADIFVWLAVDFYSLLEWIELGFKPISSVTYI